MNPILIVKCEIKLASSIGMILFGILLAGGFGLVTYMISNYWWLIGVAFGLFCVYHWSKIIIKGGRTLVFYVKENILYFTFDPTKEVLVQLENIKTTDHYTSTFPVQEIQNFWRYIVQSSGATTTDILYLKLNGKKEVLADLAYYEVKLKEDDLVKIANFLLSHNPNIQLGN